MSSEASGVGRYLRWDTVVGVLLVAVFLAGSGTTEGFGTPATSRRRSATPPRSP